MYRRSSLVGDCNNRWGRYEKAVCWVIAAAMAFSVRIVVAWNFPVYVPGEPSIANGGQSSP